MLDIYYRCFVPSLVVFARRVKGIKINSQRKQSIVSTSFLGQLLLQFIRIIWVYYSCWLPRLRTAINTGVGGWINDHPSWLIREQGYHFGILSGYIYVHATMAGDRDVLTCRFSIILEWWVDTLVLCILTSHSMKFMCLKSFAFDEPDLLIYNRKLTSSIFICYSTTEGYLFVLAWTFLGWQVTVSRNLWKYRRFNQVMGLHFKNSSFLRRLINHIIFYPFIKVEVLFKRSTLHLYFFIVRNKSNHKKSWPSLPSRLFYHAQKH